MVQKKGTFSIGEQKKVEMDIRGLNQLLFKYINSIKRVTLQVKDLIRISTLIVCKLLTW